MTKQDQKQVFLICDPYKCHQIVKQHYNTEKTCKKSIKVIESVQEQILKKIRSIIELAQCIKEELETEIKQILKLAQDIILKHTNSSSQSLLHLQRSVAKKLPINEIFNQFSNQSAKSSGGTQKLLQ